MRISTLLGLLLLIGCVKHVQVEAEMARPPLAYASDHSFAFECNKSKTDCTIYTKVGPSKPQKQLCPKDAVCTVEQVAVIYRLRRIR